MKPVGKSVLILANSDSGLYDFRREVIIALQKEGYCVHVSVPDTGYAKKIDALGCVRYETQLDRRGMNPLRDGKLFLFYLRLIRRVKPAAVLTYTIKPNIYGGMACRLLRVHGPGNHSGARWAFAETDRHFVPGKSVFRRLYLFPEPAQSGFYAGKGLPEAGSENPRDLRIRRESAGTRIPPLSAGRTGEIPFGDADHEG